MSTRTAPPPTAAQSTAQSTTGPTGPRPGAGRRGRRVFVAVLLVSVVLLSTLFAQLGCQRMREVAPLQSTDPHGRTVTGYSWSLHPAGFTVRYHDGSSQTHLWW